MLEDAEHAAVRRLVRSIIDRAVSAAGAGAAQPQPSPARALPNGTAGALEEPQQALAPSPASALANALAELVLQTPAPKRAPTGGLAAPAAASTAAGAARRGAADASGQPVVAPPAEAQEADRATGLCYDKVMEEHVGPAGERVLRHGASWRACSWGARGADRPAAPQTTWSGPCARRS